MKLELSTALLVTLLLSCLKEVHSFEPVMTMTIVGAAGASFLLSAVMVAKCRLLECCKDTRWVHKTVPGLGANIDKHLFGQHLVKEVVVAAVEGHFKYGPEKALVMSFHGSTGTGKNYVSQMIAETLYTKGMNSKYVHVISGGRDFTQEEHAKDYADSLRNWIEGNVTDCPHRLFIFDEVDKMPAGVLDAIKPYADYHSEPRFRELIFVFLSNIAGDQLFSVAQELWAEGRTRESLGLGEVEAHLYSEAYNTDGPFKGAAIIKNAVIDHHIPFLPLEYVHVVKCIEDQIRSKKLFHILDNNNRRANFIEDVAKELQFLPKDTKMFAKSGCKKVSQKVSLMARKYRSL